MKKLLSLVKMQLADKIDFSWTRSIRSIIFKVVLNIVKFALVTALFYLLFMVSTMLGVFGLSKNIPDTVLALIFTVIQILSIITCTAGLTNSLYKSADNKVLLTLPVEHNQVFFSKIILYFIYEIMKNINFTLPLFIAYGINNSAVFYYYPYLIICFVLISLLPVVLGAVLSIPWLFISTFIERYKTLQSILIILVCLFIARILFDVVALIPPNINLIAQWNTIIQEVVQPFLRDFVKMFSLYYSLTLMIVGGTLAISTNLFSGNALLLFLILIIVLAACILFAFLLAKPLFFKMASKQFEFEKKVIPPKKNRIHNKFTSPLSQELKRSFRSSQYVVLIMLQLLLPAILIFLLNKLYAAMRTSFNGQMMTMGFNMLVLYLSVLSFNNEYASIYSRDGNARFLEKTRPINPAVLTFSRLIPRIAVIIASVIISTYLYVSTTGVPGYQFITVVLTASFVATGHLLWCAELDIMNPQSQQYATLGLEFNNPNERTATILSLAISVIYAFLLYFLSTSGVQASFIKVMILALVFLVARIYLYFIRVKLYYKEK